MRPIRSGRLALAAAVVLAVAACGSAASPSPSASSAPSGSQPTGSETPGSSLSGDLRATIWTNNPAILEKYDAMAKAYKDANPSVGTITFESLPFSSYVQTVFTQIAGGNSPDIGWMTTKDSPDFIDAGALLDLAPTLTGDPAYDFADVVPNLIAPWTRDSAIYGYPFSNAVTVAYFNKDLFASAGVPTPLEMMASGDWTWEKAAPVFKKIADSADGVYGLQINEFQTFKLWHAMRYLWVGFGADPWSADGKTCRWTDPEMVDALTYLHDRIFVDGSYPGPGVNADFLAGQVGVILGTPSFAQRFADVTFEWDAVPLPAGPAGEKSTFDTAGWVSFSQGKNQDLARDFLKFVTNAENGAALAGVFVPARSSIIDATKMEAASGGLMNAEQYERAVVTPLKNATILPWVTHNFGAIDLATQAALDPLWKADADVAAVAANVCTAIQPLLPTN
jgi:multiple sugar transport system substrate-binding protein